MYGFCAECDHKLFSPIEVPNPRIPTTKSDFCRYSLRPIVHEIRKKEGNISFFRTRDGKAQRFFNRRGEVEFSKWKCEQFQIKSLKAILSAFTQGTTKDVPVSFVVREIPRIEVCASSIHIVPSKLYVNPKRGYLH